MSAVSLGSSRADTPQICPGALSLAAEPVGLFVLVTIALSAILCCASGTNQSVCVNMDSGGLCKV